MSASSRALFAIGLWMMTSSTARTRARIPPRQRFRPAALKRRSLVVLLDQHQVRRANPPAPDAHQPVLRLNRPDLPTGLPRRLRDAFHTSDAHGNHHIKVGGRPRLGPVEVGGDRAQHGPLRIVGFRQVIHPDHQRAPGMLRSTHAPFSAMDTCRAIRSRTAFI